MSAEPASSRPSALARLRQRVRRGWLAQNLVGLAVLLAIVGGLIAVDRLRGDSELGPLDGRAPSVGEPAPDFALEDADGEVVRLSDLRGTTVWLNFWATWCGPCRRELPDIDRVAAAFEGDLVVLTVNLEQSASTAEAFFDEIDVDLPIVLDTDGAVADQYRLVGLPNNFFIDEEGVLRVRHLGFLTEDQMREKLAEAGLTEAP